MKYLATILALATIILSGCLYNQNQRFQDLKEQAIDACMLAHEYGCDYKTMEKQ